MKELVEYLVSQLTDGEGVTVELKDDAREPQIVITADESHIGKIIGKQGRIAKAIRTIVKAASAREKKRYSVTIEEQKAEN